MAEEHNAKSLVERAEHAASIGDLSAADELLRNAARIQEAELGPNHPDLTSTLTNRAIIAEKTGRLGDAEAFYRRAAAIASAALPGDHHTVAESRKNLEDFCRDRGLPVEAPPVPAAASFRSRAILLTAVILGVIAVISTAVFMMRDSSPRASTTLTQPPPAASKAPESALSPRAPIAPVEKPGVPNLKGRAKGRSTPPGTQRSNAPVSLAAAQLCQTFSTRGAWRCDAAGDPAARGRLVLFTRVRSPRNAIVVHRWYRGNTLQQSVRLPIRATREGYRTYSRQSINRPGQWRIEVRSAAGDLLFEKSFSVR